MLKKLISLMAALGLAASLAIPAWAAPEAGADMEEISGNLIKYGDFDLASDVTGMLSEDGSWSDSKSFAYALNTNPANTYRDSWGSLKVTQNSANEQAERRPVLRLRRNQWYRLQGAVKLAQEHVGDTTFGIVLTNADSWDKWTWNWNILGSGERGNTVNTNMGTVKLSSESWYEFDVYFQPCLTQEQNKNAAAFEYSFSDVNTFYDQYGLIFRVGNPNQAASYYLDELSLTPVGGGVNSHFDNNAQYWKWNQYIDPQIVQFHAQEEGVADLVASGDFPDVSTVRKIAGHATLGAVLPFEQRVAMESGKAYEISMWVKGETPDKDTSYSSEYCKFIPFWFNAGSSNLFSWYYGTNWIQSGVTYTKKGEWTNIKFIVQNSISSLDGQLALRYNANASTAINQDEGFTVGSTFYVADVSVKEASQNLIGNPHFVKFSVWNDWSAKNPRSCDDPHYNSGVAETSSWSHNAGFSAKTNVENKTYIPDVTYDNSKAWGVFDLSNPDSDYVYQNCTLDSSRKYNLSVWTRTQTEGDFAFVVGDSVIPAETALTRNGWSKLTAADVSPAVSGAQPVGLTMVDGSGSYLTEGSFEFTAFTAAEAQEAVVIDNITIDGLTADSEMSVNVEASSTAPYAGLYKYLVGGSIVMEGRINAGEAIPALAYSEDYIGSDIQLILKPLSVYNTWGADAESNVYTIPAETEDAQASLLSIEDADGNIVMDDEGYSDISFGETAQILGSVELSSQKVPAKATILLAGYSADGSLIDVKINTQIIPANTKNQRVETEAIEISNANIKKAVVMVWNDNMEPLSSAVYVTKE